MITVVRGEQYAFSATTHRYPLWGAHGFCFHPQGSPLVRLRLLRVQEICGRNRADRGYL